jgi:hypothetical protein
VVFLMMAILIEVRWNLGVVLTCISFMARNGEQKILSVEFDTFSTSTATL